jgi:hypothetical protein
VLHVVAPLAVGGSVYVAWRAPELWLHRGVGLVLGTENLIAFRAAVGSAPGWLPLSVVGSAPNALWTYAGTYALGAVWAGSREPERWAWMAAAPALSIGAELGQAVGAVPGVFDLLDLLTAALASGAAFFMTSRRHGG